ncbi:MAG: hypothetical protein AMXMBFR58_29670 [Phycisphaerae bacterium]
MTTYSQISFGSSLSQLVELMETQHDRMRAHERGTTEPTVKVTGLIWNKTDYSVIGDAWVRWNGSSWTLVLDPEFAQLNAGGTVAMAADLSAGGFKITNLGAPSANGHAARYEDAYAATQGRFKMFADGLTSAVLQSDASPTTTFNTCGFTPRRVRLRLYGDVTPQAGGAAHGTIDKELTYDRWEGHAGSGFPGTAGKTLLEQVTVGSATINVYVEPKYTAPLGFWISIEDDADDSRQDVEMVQAVAEYGLGQ